MTMLNANCYKIVIVFLSLALLYSCDSRQELIIPENDSFSSQGVSKIKIENYVNRLFIDLIGRGPTNTEKTIEVDKLNENDLSEESRVVLINRLMTDTSFSVNEGSYNEAYVNNLYLLAKIRCLEGVADGRIENDDIVNFEVGAFKDSLNLDWEGYNAKMNEIRKLKLILASPGEMLKGNLRYHEVYGFMINNSIYDFLNMNAFNFIRASFDQLLFRIPSDQEYNQAFDMVELEIPNMLLGETGNSKEDYIRIMINSTAMKEGMIRWIYQVFLQREGSAAEIATLLELYKENENVNQIITKIIATDEYANFY
ncbi:hypothetical protein N9B82_03985 [Saprospiraceae bacterium]|nr:hypothetical protein [Saprospiraceae bacterium]